MSLISSAGALQALSAGAQQRVESDHIGSKLHLGYLSTKTKGPLGPWLILDCAPITQKAWHVALGNTAARVFRIYTAKSLSTMVQQCIAKEATLNHPKPS